MKPKFKNVQNKCYETEDGPIWASRSVAIVASIIFKINKEFYILSQKRSKEMDSSGLQALVSGYMDWNENGEEAILREVFEEAGLYLPDIENYLVYDNRMQPFFVKTEPNENRQNITLNYVLFYDFEDDGHWALIEAEKFKCAEVDSVDIIRYSDVEKYEWAFDHDKRIRSAMTYMLAKI